MLYLKGKKMNKKDMINNILELQRWYNEWYGEVLLGKANNRTNKSNIENLQKEVTELKEQLNALLKYEDVSMKINNDKYTVIRNKGE